jgi:hypothetical protein
MDSMKITYSEGPDGLLYPDLTTTEPGKPLGKYGLMLESHLQKHRPVLYYQMIAEGTLNSFLEQRDEQAHAMLTEREDRLRTENPPPHTKDFWEMTRYHQAIRDQAEEAVLQSLLEIGD